MKIKKIKYIICSIVSLLTVVVLLSGCSGSKKIQGTWNAQDGSGQNFTIIFNNKKVSVNGKEYSYTQTAVGTQNGTNYYGITQNGKNYSIIFPDKNEDVALMIEPDSTDNYLKGKLLYAMNKKRTPDYNSYVKKYLK
ncbi:glycosyltransferase [Lactococcus lactis]|uniref:glycosyltransferase n=1 Tax=Lactococcus lactis TaxID=1358 RepID=UPI00111EFF91|nr:glycosyltransferase [Lactococcus lactis]TNU79985.1 glycosyltransferase [Lactococcus lactis subsp. lactis]